MSFTDITSYDVRTGKIRAVGEIVFAEAARDKGQDICNARTLVYQHKTKTITLEHSYFEGSNEVIISDIPNLIKALEKAYALWGEKK